MCIQSSNIMKQQPGNPGVHPGYAPKRPPRSPWCPASSLVSFCKSQTIGDERRLVPVPAPHGSTKWWENGRDTPMRAASRRLHFSHLRIKSGYIDQLDWLINLAPGQRYDFVNHSFICVVNQSPLPNQSIPDVLKLVYCIEMMNHEKSCPYTIRLYNWLHRRHGTLTFPGL